MNWIFYSLTEFNQHQASWDKLNEESVNSPVLSSHFVSPLVKYFANENDRLAVCNGSDNLLAMTIITKRKLGVWETLQPSQAPLGLWLHKPSVPLDTLLASLRESLPFPTLLVGITQQDPELFPRPQNSGKIKTLDYIQTARIPLHGSFKDYWSQRGKNLRQNLKRQRNLLDREGIRTTLKIITDADDIPQSIVDYGRLESAGWKNEGGTAIHIENMQGQFYRDMLINFSQFQNVLVFQYFYNNELVATDICIKNAQSLIILKTTYDETIKTSSPAMLMRQEVFQYIFDKQLTNNIEFYGKVMEWHTKWSEEIRTLYHINYQNIIGLNRKFICFN